MHDVRPDEDPVTGTPVVSALQEEMWRSLPALDDATALHYGPCTEVLGPLDLEDLASSVSRAVARHDALRTGFVKRSETADVEAVLVPPEEVSVEARHRSLEELPEEERWAAACQWLREERARPFDLARPPLVRLATVGLADDRHLVLVAFHHLVLDARGARLLLGDVAAAYRPSLADAPPDESALPPPSYQDFARRDRAARADPRAVTAARTRARSLESAVALDLPVVRPEPGAPAGSCGRSLDPELVRRFHDRAAELRATPFLAHAATYAELLARHFDRDELCIGTPVGLRAGPSMGNLVGNLANSMVLPVAPGSCATFGDLVAAVRDAALEANLSRTVTALELAAQASDRGTPHHELIQSFLDFDPLPGPVLELPGVRTRRIELPPLAAHFALRWSLRLGEDPPRVEATFDRRRLDEERVRAMLDEYVVLLEAAAEDPRRPRHEVPRLGDEAYQRLVVEANRTSTPYPEDETVPSLFASTVAAAPDAPALTWRDRSWTYRQLAGHARGVADQVLATGLEPGARVGVVAWRRPETIACFLGVLRAGATYVPLDPRYPPERLEFMVRDAAIDVILDPDPEAGAPALEGARVVPVELSDAEPGPGGSEDRPTPDLTPEDPCYAMYTSGSTGRPKGVPITHRAVVRLVRDNAHVEIGPGDGFAQVASLSFDVSVLEIWAPLLNGARLVLLDDEDLQAPARLRQVLADRGVTHLWLTTPLFDLIAGGAPDAFGDLQALYVGGAVVGVETVRTILDAAPPERLIDSYGPTETCFSSYHVVTPKDLDGPSIPIGVPISNTTLHVVDRHGRPVPEGVPGELWIGGPGVSPGYLERPELTAARFHDDPFRPGSGARVYRSGDRVVRRRDGAILFLGRLDGQVKVRGHRIELGEVEAALQALPGVVAAACRVTGTGASQALAAYVVLAPDAGPTPGPEAMRRSLARRLPPFMVPSTLQLLPELPLTRHGKVDRERLPAPSSEARAGDGPPVTAPCERLLEVFREVLEAPELSPDDDVFQAGATSLQALEICSRVEAWLGVRVPLTLLREHPTARSLHDDLPGATPLDGQGSLVRLVEGEAVGALLLMPDSDLREAMVCDLARSLEPGRQVLSFRFRGYRDGSLPPGSLAELAAEFVADLERTGTRGPFGLFGHCVGGYLAWEMTRLLEERGEQVSFLFMNESWVPPGAMSLLGRQWARVHGLYRAAYWAWQAYRQGGWGEARAALSYWRAARRVGLLRAWLDTWTGRQAVGGRESRGGAMALAMADAIEGWTPGALRAPVVCGIAELRGPGRLGPDPRRGWASFTTGPTSVVRMPGRHAESLLRPWVTTSAKRLEEVWERFGPDAPGD